MNPTNILLVEDERVTALAIEDSLFSLGYRVSANVDSGAEAIESASANRPDLALMDIRIKGEMDGIDTAMVLKDRFNIPVVFLTAYADKEVLAKAKMANPMGYLMKPCKISDLKTTLEIAIYKAKMDKALKRLNQELEEKVLERTRTLADEIEIRKRAEEKLLKQTRILTDANKTLSTIIENRKSDKKDVEAECLQNIRKYALPYIDLMTRQQNRDDMLETLEMLRKTLLEMISPASKTLSAQYLKLTPREIKIAEMIRHGKKTKEIALLLNLSPCSISTYRNHIRKKMDILNAKINLETYLNSFHH